MITALQLQFNAVPIESVQSQKHLGLILESKLDVHEYISSILSKVNKLTAVLRKLQTVLPKAFPFNNLQVM